MGLSFGRDFFFFFLPAIALVPFAFDHAAAAGGSASSSSSAAAAAAEEKRALPPWQSGSEGNVAVAGRVAAAAAWCKRRGGRECHVVVAAAAAPLCVIFRRIPAMPPARGLIGSGRHCLVASDARERNIVLVTVSLFCDLSMSACVLPPVLLSDDAMRCLAAQQRSGRRRTEFAASDFIHSIPTSSTTCTSTFI